MKNLNLYDDQQLARQLRLQKDRNWDLETAVAWDSRIDFNKPLVPLDENALIFPGASQEERLAISQMMGLVMAAAICEMEECLLRLKKESWDSLHRHCPVSPEFRDLGEHFFVEEAKHSEAFRRYLRLFAEGVGIDLHELCEILPKVEGTKTEWLFKKNLDHGGYALWWVVAEVEQEFLFLYNAMAPHRSKLEPLHFSVHQRHFEEEARHASFPYLVLELLISRRSGLQNFVHAKGDLMISQVLQSTWAATTLTRLKAVKRLKDKHPLFEILDRVLPIVEQQGSGKVLWKLFTSVPYVSSLMNPNYHRNFLRFADRMGALKLPFPAPEPHPLVNY